MGKVISVTNKQNDITVGVVIDDFINKGLPALLDTAFTIGCAMQYVKDSYDIYEKQDGIVLQINAFDFIERSFDETINDKDKPDIPIIVDDMIYIFELTKSIFPRLNRIELMMYSDASKHISDYIKEKSKVPVLVKKKSF